MRNPYAKQPDYTRWKRAVAGVPAAEVDPVVDVPFRIFPSDRVATAGSCFAQHVSRALVGAGFCYLVTEKGPGTTGATAEGFGVYPARFGNVYTVRQLRQLFQRAYGLFEPLDVAWRTEAGHYLDPFRPRIQAEGFASEAALVEDREHHLASVRRMFEACDVLVFTLGLTEGWVSTRDGAVFPLAPGVTGAEGRDEWYRPVNFGVEEMSADLLAFVDDLRVVNSGVRLILTVSPVPLVATFEARHVLVSTVYSKSALRVVAEVVTRARDRIAYFPSYEIVTGPQSGNRFFAEDLREITPDGVDQVMRIFSRHFLSDGPSPDSREAAVDRRDEPTSRVDWSYLEELAGVICDEEAIDADPRS